MRSHVRDGGGRAGTIPVQWGLMSGDSEDSVKSHVWGRGEAELYGEVQGEKV